MLLVFFYNLYPLKEELQNNINDNNKIKWENASGFDSSEFPNASIILCLLCLAPINAVTSLDKKKPYTQCQMSAWLVKDLVKKWARSAFHCSLGLLCSVMFLLFISFCLALFSP